MMPIGLPAWRDYAPRDSLNDFCHSQKTRPSIKCDSGHLLVCRCKIEARERLEGKIFDEAARSYREISIGTWNRGIRTMLCRLWIAVSDDADPEQTNASLRSSEKHCRCPSRSAWKPRAHPTGHAYGPAGWAVSIHCSHDPVDHSGISNGRCSGLRASACIWLSDWYRASKFFCRCGVC